MYSDKAFLNAWCKEAKVDTPVGYYNDYLNDRLVVYSDRPGYLIGRGGKLIDKYAKKFREEFKRPHAKIELIEIKTEFANC